MADELKDILLRIEAKLDELLGSRKKKAAGKATTQVCVRCGGFYKVRPNSLKARIEALTCSKCWKSK